MADQIRPECQDLITNSILRIANSAGHLPLELIRVTHPESRE